MLTPRVPWEKQDSHWKLERALKHTLDSQGIIWLKGRCIDGANAEGEFKTDKVLLTRESVRTEKSDRFASEKFHKLKGIVFTHIHLPQSSYFPGILCPFFLLLRYGIMASIVLPQAATLEMI